MDVAAKEHRENLNEMEYTFFKEKVVGLKTVTDNTQLFIVFLIKPKRHT